MNDPRTNLDIKWKLLNLKQCCHAQNRPYVTYARMKCVHIANHCPKLVMKSKQDQDEFENMRMVPFNVMYFVYCFWVWATTVPFMVPHKMFQLSHATPTEYTDKKKV